MVLSLRQPFIDRIVLRAPSAAALPAAHPAQAKLAALGQEIFPRERQNPRSLDAHQKAEIERWWPVIKEAGIKVE